jgi:YidC/Oxa1 family membrane protein insertase
MRDLDQSAAEGGAAASYQVAQNGWLGLTDKYWMAALAPKPGQSFTGVFKTVQAVDGEIFQADMRLPVMTVPAGQSASVETNVFAGAKEWEAVRDYEKDLQIGGFTEAMNWGTFFFLTKPMFQLLHFLYLSLGNMGWAILSLTLIVKTLLFPLAYKSFVSMSRMKKLQPEMEKLKERVGDDKQKLQQEMMALYKKEKVNPASGCLPIVLQIPIFFSLYKVISISLELRHAPFILWIKDLSAPDPTSILNLFGLLPIDTPEPGSMLAIASLGVFPILLGITMWMQQKLNPAPTDPMQQKIFAWMPWIFMFMLGSFASGLVVYWCFNNILTFIQQFIIMRSQGVEVDFFGNVKKSFSRKKATAGGAPEPAVVRAKTAPANDNPGKHKTRRQRKKGKGAAVEASNPGSADPTLRSKSAKADGDTGGDSGPGGAVNASARSGNRRRNSPICGVSTARPSLRRPNKSCGRSAKTVYASASSTAVRSPCLKASLASTACTSARARRSPTSPGAKPP